MLARRSDREAGEEGEAPPASGKRRRVYYSIQYNNMLYIVRVIPHCGSWGRGGARADVNMGTAHQPIIVAL